MKLKRNAPLNLADNEPPVAEPDTDFDMPPVDHAEPDTSASATATAAPELAPEPQARPMTYAGAGNLAPLAAPMTMPVRRSTEASRTIYILAFLASVLWAALAIFAIGFQWPVGTVAFEPFQLAVFGVLAVAPIGFIWVFAYGVSQAARLSAEVARAHDISEAMLLPAARAASETGSAVEAVRGEIESATAAAAAARTELMALREALAEETERLSAAAAQSARTAENLSVNLGREREEMTTLSARLDTQAAAVADTVTRQARMVAEASDLAQAQIGEAEAALASRAADLAAAAGEASDAARIASEDLARQTQRLETASVGVSDQLRSLEDTLTQQRAELVTVAHGLRADNEDFAVRLESQRAQVAEMLGKARLSVGEINDAATSGAGAIRDLAETAAANCQQLADTLKAERDLLSAGALQSLGAVSEAARYERETMESNARRSLEAMAEQAEASHRIAEGYSETARLKIEALSETAFAAGQRAEAAYEARLEEANGIVARSADLVDKAAEAAVARLETTTRAAREALAELESAVAGFEARTAALPQEAAAQAEVLKAQLAGSFDDLLASARSAADETQAIDQAFQERVRRNYEMLSEAVRLMGVVGPASRAALNADLGARPAGQPAPAARHEPQAPPAQPAREPVASQDIPTEPAARPARRGLFERTARRDLSGAEDAGLRPRLKLSPTAADREVSSVFDTAPRAPRVAPDEDQTLEDAGWTWQQLLGSMDDAPVEDDQLEDRLLGEIEGLGVDLAAILPISRMGEVAAVLLAGDEPGARQVVRHLAPAAIRRLSRRLMGERGLRGHAERYVRRYQIALDHAAREGRGGPEVADLLSSDGGRAYLLFDTVLSDLP